MDNHRLSRIPTRYAYYCINECYGDYTNRNLGINTKSTTLQDLNGRPQYLLEDRDPVKELV